MEFKGGLNYKASCFDHPISGGGHDPLRSPRSWPDGSSSLGLRRVEMKHFSIYFLSAKTRMGGIARSHELLNDFVTRWNITVLYERTDSARSA